MIRDKLKGIIPWQSWPHLLKLLDAFAKHRLIIILKPKQIGVTWLVQAANLHLALFNEGANIITLSKGEQEASEELDYCRFMHSQLPDFLRLTPDKNQQGLLSFPSSHSKMRALPSTPHSGVGFGGATRVVLDEFAYHEYAELNYPEIMPMVSAGGQLIILSTTNPLKPDSKFVEIFQKAFAGENNFYPVFLPYNVLPERTEEWRQDQLKDLDEYEVFCRYPRTIEEALSPPNVICRFDSEALKGMEDDCWKPLRTEFNGAVRIYREPIVERRYCFTIDPSEGGDPNCGVVIDTQSLEEVANYHGRLKIDEQAKIIFELYKRYNQAYIAPERNAAGTELIRTLIALGVENFYYMKKDTPGFYTHSAIRPYMIGDLAELIRLRKFIIRYPETIKEMRSFVKTEKHKDGAALRGAHDDLVMMWAIAGQVIKKLPNKSNIHWDSWMR